MSSRLAIVSGAVLCVAAPRWAAADGTNDRDVPEPAPATEPADPPPDPSLFEPPPLPFGAPGEIAISGTSGLGAGYTSYSGSKASSLSFSFGPAVDVFVARNVSIGLSATIAYSDAQGYGADGSLVKTTTTNLSGAARVGYNVPLGASLSLWPRLLLGYEWQQENQRAVDGGTTSVGGNPLGYPTTTYEGLWTELQLPLVLHLAPHAFAGFGPSLFHEFSNPQGGSGGSGERTSVGALLDVGGWFGGRRDAQADAASAQVPVQPFGSARDIVISNAVAVQGSWTGYAHTSSSATSIAVTPGLDVFFADDFSIGVTVSGSYSGSTGIDATTGDRITFSRHTYTIAPRFGADIPLGAHVSFWPTLSAGLGKSDATENEAANSNDQNELYVWLALNAPVLVHPASHFFIGFGPSLSQDVWHSVTYPNVGGSSQNRATTIGAGLVVGGVL